MPEKEEMLRAFIAVSSQSGNQRHLCDDREVICNGIPCSKCPLHSDNHKAFAEILQQYVTNSTSKPTNDR